MDLRNALNKTGSYFYRWTGLLVLCAWIISCAQQKPLTGGERDFVAPMPQFFIPPLFTTDFNSKSIYIQFDEYVQLNNIYQELIISPPLVKQPEIKVKKKGVVIELQEDLKANTTYTFNFGEGIVDVNESNKAENLLYVFSTGATLDSLSISGNGFYPNSGEKASSVKIMLYDDSTSLTDIKIPMPLYFGKANKEGSFAIGFLPDKSFNAIALEDLNGNYQVDTDERVSIIQKDIRGSADSILLSNDFELFPQVPYTPDLSSLDVDSLGRLFIPWKKGYNGRIDFDARLKSGRSLKTLFNKNRDTLFVLLHGIPTNAEEELYYSFGEEKDTLMVPFFEEAFSKKMKISAGVGVKIKSTDSLFFRAPVAVNSFKSQVVEWKKDSTESGIGLLETFDSIHFKVKLPLKPASNYKVLIPPGAFEDALGNTNDSLKISFTTYKLEDLGNIIFEVDSSLVQENAILELRNKSGDLMGRLENVQAGKWELVSMQPNEYSVLYFVDKNGNGEWDALNFKEQLNAEFIYPFPDKVNVRANWDVKVKLELGK